MVTRLSTMQETRVRSLGWEDPLEKEMAIHSRAIAWKISWTEEPGRLQPMGSQRVGHDWATSLPFTSTCFLKKYLCFLVLDKTMFNFFLNRFIEKPVMTASGQTESRLSIIVYRAVPFAFRWCFMLRNPSPSVPTPPLWVPSPWSPWPCIPVHTYSVRTADASSRYRSYSDVFW